ncbi:hypothetical protein CKO51_04075 [Rhodopirellula sp. SM50]|nr:hypothetical protein CKO51_04075 [Rhodopirellula sp. SM50]
MINSCLPRDLSVQRADAERAERWGQDNAKRKKRRRQNDSGQNDEDRERGRQGDKETRRGGDKERGRQGEGETRRGGDKERGRQGWSERLEQNLQRPSSHPIILPSHHSAISSFCRHRFAFRFCPYQRHCPPKDAPRIPSPSV